MQSGAGARISGRCCCRLAVAARVDHRQRRDSHVAREHKRLVHRFGRIRRGREPVARDRRAATAIDANRCHLAGRRRQPARMRVAGGRSRIAQQPEHVEQAEWLVGRRSGDGPGRCTGADSRRCLRLEDGRKVKGVLTVGLERYKR